MDSVLMNAVVLENSLRDLIGLWVTKTIVKSSKRTVYREGLVYSFSDGVWTAADNNGEDFEFTFDDFITNDVFVHSSSSSS
jgi:hypothetical protein